MTENFLDIQVNRTTDSEQKILDDENFDSGFKKISYSDYTEIGKKLDEIKTIIKMMQAVMDGSLSEKSVNIRQKDYFSSALEDNLYKQYYDICWSVHSVIEKEFFTILQSLKKQKIKQLKRQYNFDYNEEEFLQTKSGLNDFSLPVSSTSDCLVFDSSSGVDTMDSTLTFDIKQLVQETIKQIIDDNTIPQSP